VYLEAKITFLPVFGPILPDFGGGGANFGGGGPKKGGHFFFKFSGGGVGGSNFRGPAAM
jgi:hypothetical protein